MTMKNVTKSNVSNKCRCCPALSPPFLGDSSAMVFIIAPRSRFCFLHDVVYSHPMLRGEGTPLEAKCQGACAKGTCMTCSDMRVVACKMHATACKLYTSEIAVKLGANFMQNCVKVYCNYACDLQCAICLHVACNLRANCIAVQRACNLRASCICKLYATRMSSCI